MQILKISCIFNPPIFSFFVNTILSGGSGGRPWGWSIIQFVQKFTVYLAGNPSTPIESTVIFSMVTPSIKSLFVEILFSVISIFRGCKDVKNWYNRNPEPTTKISRTTLMMCTIFPGFHFNLYKMKPFLRIFLLISRF